jgi:hypothetical protein
VELYLSSPIRQYFIAVFSDKALEEAEIFKATRIQVAVFRVLTPGSDVIGYQLHPEWSSETLVSYHITEMRQNPEELDSTRYIH